MTVAGDAIRQIAQLLAPGDARVRRACAPRGAGPLALFDALEGRAATVVDWKSGRADVRESLAPLKGWPSQGLASLDDDPREYSTLELLELAGACASTAGLALIRANVSSDDHWLLAVPRANADAVRRLLATAGMGPARVLGRKVRRKQKPAAKQTKRSTASSDQELLIAAFVLGDEIRSVWELERTPADESWQWSVSFHTATGFHRESHHAYGAGPRPAMARRLADAWIRAGFQRISIDRYMSSATAKHPYLGPFPQRGLYQHAVKHKSVECLVVEGTTVTHMLGDLGRKPAWGEECHVHHYRTRAAALASVPEHQQTYHRDRYGRAATKRKITRAQAMKLFGVTSSSRKRTS